MELNGLNCKNKKQNPVLTFDVKLGLVKFQLSLLITQFFFQVFILQRDVYVTKKGS